MRGVRRVAIAVALIVVVPLLLALLGTLIPYPSVDDDANGMPVARRILVVGNTIHTDIAIPIEPKSLATFHELIEAGQPVLHPKARWLLIGWGGRSFYLETPSLADIKPGPTFRAFTIDSSVMHVDILGEINQADPAVVAIGITEAAYDRLLATLLSGFTRRNGHILPIAGYAYGGADKFYEGEGSFNALVGCNVWTARMLRSAGIRTGIWNPLPISLAASLRLFDGDRLVRGQ